MHIVVYLLISTAVTTIAIAFLNNVRWKQLSHLVNAHALYPNLAGSTHFCIKQALSTATNCCHITNPFDIYRHAGLEGKDRVTVDEDGFASVERFGHHCKTDGLISNGRYIRRIE